jgi:hypothetical protein
MSNGWTQVFGTLKRQDYTGIWEAASNVPRQDRSRLLRAGVLLLAI